MSGYQKAVAAMLAEWDKRDQQARSVPGNGRGK